MKGILIVRKYKNRRLYDTERSVHITREELLGIVRTGRDVQVQDAATGDDVTSETLLQLMLTESGLAPDQIPPEFLFFLLRADKGILSRFFKEFLPLAMQQFDSFLKVYRHQQDTIFRGMMGMGGWMNPWFPTQPAPEEDLGEKLRSLEKEIERLKKSR